MSEDLLNYEDEQFSDSSDLSGYDTDEFFTSSTDEFTLTTNSDEDSFDDRFEEISVTVKTPLRDKEEVSQQESLTNGRIQREMMMDSSIEPVQNSGKVLYDFKYIINDKTFDKSSNQTHKLSTTSFVPRLNRSAITTLKHVRDQQPHEVSGSIYFDGSGNISKISKNNGEDHSVEMEDNCVNCYHTHPNHPIYLSPPSGTDMVHAYALGGLHWALANEGIYVYWKSRHSDVSEEYKNITDERSPYDALLRDLVVVESPTRDLLKYTRAALYLLGITVVFIPWE
jgi:proteasome lid subunit RPN8/RPN11